jgi:hypothetical protein
VLSKADLIAKTELSMRAFVDDTGDLTTMAIRRKWGVSDTWIALDRHSSGAFRILGGVSVVDGLPIFYNPANEHIALYVQEKTFRLAYREGSQPAEAVESFGALNVILSAADPHGDREHSYEYMVFDGGQSMVTGEPKILPHANFPSQLFDEQATKHHLLVTLPPVRFNLSTFVISHYFNPAHYDSGNPWVKVVDRTADFAAMTGYAPPDGGVELATP